MSYSSGATVVLYGSSGEYAVAHYLTFASAADILVFEHSRHSPQFVA